MYVYIIPCGHQQSNNCFPIIHDRSSYVNKWLMTANSQSYQSHTIQDYGILLIGDD